MTKFRDLNIGDTFDFISPNTSWNSFYATCVKLSSRTYRTVPDDGLPHMQVGSINAQVYHVNEHKHE